MVIRKLLATLAVLTASAVVPSAASATPSVGAPGATVAPGTQVGSEGVRAQPRADGIIAILIGA